MKTVGIIGGLGPETTSDFYLEVIFGCHKKNKVQRPPMLIWNVPLLYQIEKEVITKAEGEERCIPYLADAAKRLEKGGADFIVMPCNSLHIFIKELRESVRIPVLSILEETVEFLRKNRIDKVGLLATTATIKRKMYERELKKNGIMQIRPDDFEQEKIGRMIHNIVMNRHANKDRAELMKIISRFEDKKAKNVILACTDLQLLIPKHPGINIYDTMKILADATVREILR